MILLITIAAVFVQISKAATDSNLGRKQSCIFKCLDFVHPTTDSAAVKQTCRSYRRAKKCMSKCPASPMRTRLDKVLDSTNGICRINCRDGHICFRPPPPIKEPLAPIHQVQYNGRRVNRRAPKYWFHLPRPHVPPPSPDRVEHIGSPGRAYVLPIQELLTDCSVDQLVELQELLPGDGSMVLAISANRSLTIGNNPALLSACGRGTSNWCRRESLGYVVQKRGECGASVPLFIYQHVDGREIGWTKNLKSGLPDGFQLKDRTPLCYLWE